jgi:predicted dehydrogenase
MKQLFIRGGQVVVEEVPAPPVDARGVLVETRAAAISVATETSSLERDRPIPWEQLRSRQFRQRIVQQLGKGTLWRSMRRRLQMGPPSSPPRTWLGSPTGYSCAGRVLAVGEEVSDLGPGDRVACAGSPHAEVVYAPRRLAVRVPEAVTDAEAAFVALGSIALHGVHQADLRGGESVLVMGLGIVGQLVAQTARACGARVIVTDLVEARLEAARRMGAHLALRSAVDDAVARVLDFTGGLGADAVILCMGGDSPRPTEQALELVRDRGRIVIVGTPRLEIPRAPFYRKEVELRIARSYGPGRYDPEYETQGHDYPPAYVRWTEQRNMAEFLRLVAEGQVDVASLVTHAFPFEEAPAAYKVAGGPAAESLGILLLAEGVSAAAAPLPKPAPPGRQLGVAVVGTGSFARAFHLPNLGRTEGARLRAVVARHAKSAQEAAAAFGAELATTDLEEVLRDPAVDLVLIATPHNLHASQTIAALEAGKAVFCEKPMGMDPSEVEQVVAAVERTGGFYAIGFNRRFAPSILRAKELLAGRKGPLVISYRVMGSFLPADHWVYDPVRGGGRVVGEMCHFFDLIHFLVGREPQHLAVTGGTLSHPGTGLVDNLACMLSFDDGSVASLVYGDLGQKSLSKERLEIWAGEGALLIDDFRELEVDGFSGQRGARLAQVDKGYRRELQAIAEALQAGRPSPVDARAGEVAMRCSFDTLRLLAQRQEQ